MKQTWIMYERRRSLICGLLGIVLMGQSGVVSAAEELVLPSDFRVSEYFSFFGSGGIDWRALNDPNNNPILVACLKGVANESLKPPGILDVRQRLERLERGGLIKNVNGRYSLAFPAVVGDKRDRLQKYAEQAALQLVPFGEKMIVQIRGHLAGRDEMIYHVLWSVIMDGGPAWDAARAEMNKRITAGDTSIQNKAWLLYPSHPFQVGTNGYDTSYGHLAITWSRNTPSPNAIGSIITRDIRQVSQAIEQGRAVEPADLKDALGKYGLVDETGKIRLYIIKADSQAAQSYAEVGAQFGRQMMTQLDVNKVAGMLEVSPGIAFVIAYHEICWQLLQDLAEKKALGVPLIVAKGGTDTSKAYLLVSLAIIQSIDSPRPGSSPVKEAQTPGQPTSNRLLSLDGQGDCMRVADSQSLHSFTEAITIEVWLKVSSFYPEDGAINSIIRKNLMSGAENFLLRFRNIDGSPCVQMGLGEIGTLSGPFEFAANKWYRVAGTYDGRTITVLVKGVVVASQNASGRLHIDQSDLYLGKGDPTFSSGEYFHGELDEIRIWNVARSPEQIRAAMNTSLTGKEEGLVACWNFDDGTAKDLSGHGNDGVLIADARIVQAPRPAQEQPSETDKTTANQERDISAYFEKTKNEILQGRKFSDQSTPVNALLTLISAYHHQDRNTLEQIFPIVRQKQFERLASPETRSQMLAIASKSIARSVEIENDPPRESDLCAVYSSDSPEKPADQVWSFAYVGGAWRFAGSTSATDNWRAQAEQAEAMTRTILQSEAEKTKTLTTDTLQQKADKIVGKWQAILAEFDQKYVVRFWRKPDGTLAGAATRQSPDDRPFDTVTFENGKLRFEEKVNQGIFEGTMKEDGLTIEGKWQRPGMLTPCVLKRVDEAHIEDKGQSDGRAEQASEKQIQLRNKLVAWWKLDEADGNDVADSSGSGHAGKLVGNPRWQPSGGKVGGALAFDGAGDFVQIGDESAFDLTGPITIAAWIKVGSFDKRWQAIVTKGDTAWRLQRNAEENTLAFHCTGITSLTGQRPEGIEGKKNVNDGQWHHVVGIYDGATIALYTDGVLDNSSKVSGSVQMNDSVVMIGGNSEQADRDWNGLIDEVCIIAGAIDANAAHALYTGTDPVTIAQTANPQLQGPGKLLAWWKFENDPNDSAGANHGTIHGNPTFVDGKVGLAISFGGNDYVDFGKPSLLNFVTGDWTISAWIKTTQSGSEPVNRGTVFAYGGDEAGGIRYTLAVNEEYLGTLVLTTDDDTSKLQAFGKTTVNDGKWHHVVGMRNADQIRVYVDGALDGDNSLPAGYDLFGVSQHNAYIGAITDHRDSSLFKYFIGVIDEVCIFGGAVNADGIRSLYAGENPMKVGRTAIVARSTQAQPPPRQVTGAVASGSIEGNWRVSTNPVIIQIQRKPDGILTASVVAENPDVASPVILLDEVTFENGRLQFKIASQQAVFEGTMKEDGLTIEGQFRGQGQTQNVILKRVVAAATEAAPAAQDQIQAQARGTSRITTALILVLVLAGVVAAVVFFLVRSSISR